MNLHCAVNDLLMRGTDDWVHAPEVAWVAQSTGGAVTPDEVQELSLKMIGEVVRQGLMVIGDVTEEGFREWDLPAEKALKRVEREWRALRTDRVLGHTAEGAWKAQGMTPQVPGEICWLRNTEKGNEIGERLLGIGKPSP